jgi:hypothetical protein
MKRLILNILLVSIMFVVSNCFTEIPEIVKVVPFEEIQAKLDELRNLQTELIDAEVDIVDKQAIIDALIAEINSMVPTGSNPLTYSIGIVSAGIIGEQVGIANATVSIDIRGVRSTATTNTDGQVVFENLSEGIVLVHIAVSGYTDVSFIANLIGGSVNITSSIGLYPTTIANGAASLSGTLYYDPDRTDDIIDVLDPDYGKVSYNNTATSGDIVDFLPAERRVLIDGVDTGLPVQPLLDAREQSWETINTPISIFAFVRPNAAQYGYVPVATPGNIILAIYEEMFASTVSSGSDGTYNLVLPGGPSGNSFRIHFQEFLGNETYFRAENNITAPPSTTFTSRDREVTFTPLYSFIRASTFTPGTPFDNTNVNNFNSTIFHAESIPGNFFFGARTRNE